MEFYRDSDLMKDDESLQLVPHLLPVQWGKLSLLFWDTENLATLRGGLSGPMAKSESKRENASGRSASN